MIGLNGGREKPGQYAITAESNAAKFLDYSCTHRKHLNEIVAVPLIDNYYSGRDGRRNPRAFSSTQGPREEFLTVQGMLSFSF